jgi:hypothetical protein
MGASKWRLLKNDSKSLQQVVKKATAGQSLAISQTLAALSDCETSPTKFTGIKAEPDDVMVPSTKTESMKVEPSEEEFASGEDYVHAFLPIDDDPSFEDPWDVLQSSIAGLARAVKKEQTFDAESFYKYKKKEVHVSSMPPGLSATEQTLLAGALAAEPHSVAKACKAAKEMTARKVKSSAACAREATASTKAQAKQQPKQKAKATGQDAESVGLKQTKKHVHSRAYHGALSKSLREGKSKEEAKVIARRAASSAVSEFLSST